MPGGILIAFVPELRLYGFWHAEGFFPELLRILEIMGDGLAQCLTHGAGSLKKQRSKNKGVRNRKRNCFLLLDLENDHNSPL